MIPRHVTDTAYRQREGLDEQGRPIDTTETNNPVDTTEEPPSQDDHTTTTSSKEKQQAENNAAITTVTGTSSTATAVFVCSKKGKGGAKAKDLYDIKKRNIRTGGITYTCSHVRTLPRGVFLKVYQCANVKDPKAGWICRPSYRIPQKPTEGTKKLQKFEGRLEGTFSKSSFFFGAAERHTCTIKHGGCPSDLDLRPPSIVIAAAQSWGITNTMLSQMKDTLKNSPENWWGGLPKQDRARDWLKRAGEATPQNRSPSRIKLRPP